VVKKVSPAAGFSARFQARLAMQKAAERRRKLWGSALFTLGGVAILMAIAAPYLISFFASPAAWITSLIEWGVFVVTTLWAMGQAGSVLMDVIPSFIPAFVWMFVVSALAGFGLLWSISIWRFVRVPRGV
jgi:hypothetical protein